MHKNVLRRAGSIALATAMSVTMMPTGSLSFAKESVEVDALQVASTKGSGVNLPLQKTTTVSGGYSKDYNASYDQNNKYDGDDLGCVYTKEATTFKVWSPTASKVILCRYTTGSDSEQGAKSLGEVEMTKEGSVWSTTVQGDIVNTYYTFKVTNNGKTTESVDIYAKAVGVNGKRAMVVDLESTDPANWDKDYNRSAQNLSDMITWEIHVNDFSDMGSSAGFKNKGKYLAFTEDGTKLTGTDYETGIDYLKKLGITHVQIMPMYDYGSVDETKPTEGSNYNWGYDPANFNVPEGSYSTNPYDGNVRINEMKQMIQALHDAGIKVVMDVVYNHTYVSKTPQDYMTFSPYDNFVPNYYYRTNASGVKTNGSGCGNEVRSEGYMTNKYIRESILYWADEYNLDGFRFDLMGLIDNQTMKDIRTDLDATFGKNSVLLYGEGWTGDGGQDTSRAGKWSAHELAAANIGFFNDTGRDCLHGTPNSEHVGQTGFVQQNVVADSFDNEKYPLGIFGMIQGSVGKSQDKWWMWRAYCNKNSNQTVTYDSCHDNKTLWDKMSETVKDNGMLTKLNMQTGGVLLTSHGGTFLHAGEEFCRTKNGVENSYSSGTEVNKIDWSRMKNYASSMDFYQGMIAIRKAFSGFRTEYTSASENLPANDTNGGFRQVGNNNMTNMDNFTNCSGSNIHSIGYYLSNKVSGEWDQVAVLINNDNADKTATLSASDGSSAWVLVSNGSKASVKGVETVNGNSIKVPAKSVVVAVPKKTFDANPNVGQSASTVTLKVSESVIETTPGSKVSFTATAKADEKVTLKASGLPEGASFDETTGTFTWDNASAGTYEVLITAVAGSNSTKKTVTIKVVAATSALGDLIKSVDAAGIKQDYISETAWNDLQEALAQAKTVAENTSAEEKEISTAKNKLQKAYDAVTAEQKSRDALSDAVSKAGTAIVAAKANALNTADLMDDASDVLKSAEAILKGTAAAKAYDVAKANLEDSVNSLAIGAGKASIVVTDAPFTEVYAYAWTGTTAADEKKLLGKWPGQKMTKNDDGDYVLDMSEIVDGSTEYNLIINGGETAKKQSTQMTGSGVVTVSVAETSTATDSYGNQTFTGTAKSEAAAAGLPERFTTGVESAIALAKDCTEADYTDSSYSVLSDAVKAAEAVVADKTSTQLDLNKAARSVRAAYVALEKKTVAESPATPTPTATPVTETPAVATETPAPTEATATPEIAAPTPTAEVTEAKLIISDILVDPEQKAKIGETVTVYAAVANVTGDVKYQFQVYFGEKTTETYGNEYSDSSNFSFAPSKVGTYRIVVSAKDASGAIATKTVSYTVVAKTLKAKLTAKVAKVKKATKISVTVSGGQKAYKYKYIITNSKGKKVYKKNYCSSKAISWKAKAAGTYKVKVWVKDSLKTVKTVTKKIKIKKK